MNRQLSMIALVCDVVKAIMYEIDNRESSDEKVNRLFFNSFFLLTQMSTNLLHTNEYKITALLKVE